MPEAYDFNNPKEIYDTTLLVPIRRNNIPLPFGVLSNSVGQLANMACGGDTYYTLAHMASEKDFSACFTEAVNWMVRNEARKERVAQKRAER